MTDALEVLDKHRVVRQVSWLAPGPYHVLEALLDEGWLYTRLATGAALVLPYCGARLAASPIDVRRGRHFLGPLCRACLDELVMKNRSPLRHAPAALGRDLVG